MRRKKTTYPGVYYREAERIGGKGLERVYYIVFKQHGRTHEEKVGRQYADDMTPARAARIRAERIEGKRPSRKEVRLRQAAEKEAEAGRWTFNHIWTVYLESRPDLKGRVTDQNRYDLHVRPVFGEKQPSELIPLDLDRLRISLMKKKTPGTVKNVLELLRRLINFAVKRQLCPGPSFKIELPRVDNERTEDLNPEQLNALLQAIDEDNTMVAAMLKLALLTGLRRGEIFRLKWQDIDPERGFIRINAPKGGKSVSIPIGEPVKELLSRLPRDDRSPYVFPGRAGQQRVDAKKAANKIKKRAGLPKSFRIFHGLRHVFASTLASSGQVDLYVLQRLLTHKSPSMTARYSHLRDEALRRASNLAGELIEQTARPSEAAAVVNLSDRR
ncbi:MAG: site-specific integrase [Thermodesulfobacteriota bacterium]